MLASCAASCARHVAAEVQRKQGPLSSSRDEVLHLHRLISAEVLLKCVDVRQANCEYRHGCKKVSNKSATVQDLQN